MGSSDRASSNILIYTELLANIRQVSAIVTLPSPSTPQTRAVLSGDCELLTISHNGNDTVVRLPAQIASSSSLRPFIPGSMVMSWRLPAAGLPARPAVEDFSQPDNAPWTARDLSAHTILSCRKCFSPLLEPGQLNSWKDLPSENWAEMMDFWHCHKPHEHAVRNVTAYTTDNPSKDQQLSSSSTRLVNGHTVMKAGYPSNQVDLADKGYGANSKLMTQPQTGFVDLTSFLVHTEDCLGIQLDIPDTMEVGASSKIGASAVCKSCSAEIGFQDEDAQGLRLLKWRIAISEGNNERRVYPAAYFIAAMLLSKISAQATRRFNIMNLNADGSTSQKGILHIWVMTTNTRYTCYHEGQAIGPQAALKIHYKLLSNDEVSAVKETNDTEDLSLPQDALDELIRCLTTSTQRLPENVRKFGTFHVGMIERYETERS